VELIEVVASTTDLIRKQAAIFLSLLSMDEHMKEVIKTNHGTEVLHSIAQYVI